MIREYVIQEKIGTGCYGVVYKAYKLYEPTIYVLKQIPLIGLTQEQIYQVLTEAKILSLIKSNYVVKYYDSFLLNSSLFKNANKNDISKYRLLSIKSPSSVIQSNEIMSNNKNERINTNLHQKISFDVRKVSAKNMEDKKFGNLIFSKKDIFLLFNYLLCNRWNNSPLLL